MLEKGSFNAPDRIQDAALGQTKVVTIGGTTVERWTLKPGWRGMEDHGSPHLQIQLTGRMRFQIADGTEEDFGPGDVGIMPHSYESWVVGNKSATILRVIMGDQPTAILKIAAQDHDRPTATETGGDFITALNRRNPLEIANFFSLDADFINVRGKVIHGCPEIERYFAVYFQNSSQLLGNNLFRMYDSYIRNIGPNIINADIYWNLVEAANPSQSIPYSSGLLNTLLIRGLGGWNILMMHSIDLMQEDEEIEIDITT